MSSASTTTSFAPAHRPDGGPHARPSDRGLAARLLADESVRSVTIDPVEGEARLTYQDSHVGHKSLTWMAERFQSDAQLLAGAGVPPIDEVDCWPDPVSGRASYVRTPQQATGWRRAMHLSLAAVWFTLAVLGAILPGLPCTCFLLLCSYSLCRSSKRLHERLLDNKWFGPALRHWRVHRGVRPGVKTKALTMLTLMVGLSLAYAPLTAAAWWIVAAAGAIGATCIARLRVIED